MCSFMKNSFCPFSNFSLTVDSISASRSLSSISIFSIAVIRLNLSLTSLDSRTGWRSSGSDVLIIDAATSINLESSLMAKVLLMIPAGISSSSKYVVRVFSKSFLSFSTSSFFTDFDLKTFVPTSKKPLLFDLISPIQTLLVPSMKTWNISPGPSTTCITEQRVPILNIPFSSGISIPGFFCVTRTISFPFLFKDSSTAFMEKSLPTLKVMDV